MTTRSIDPQGENQGPSAPAPESPLQQETVVTHGADQDITERRSVGGPPAAAAPEPARTATSRTVVRDEAAGKRRTVAQITQIIWFGVGLVEVLLALRLVLKLTAANQAADFTQLILGVTKPLVAAFFGIFPSASAADSLEFEPASVVAMIVYFLIGIGLVQVVRILYGETRESD